MGRTRTLGVGEINAFSTGIGSTEAAACFAEGRLWFKVPEAFDVGLSGKFKNLVSGKDLILRLITDIGVDGANYKAFDISGPGVAWISVSDRLTIANMAIEGAGGKAGIFPYDRSTEEYLKKRAKGSYTPVAPDNGGPIPKDARV